MATFKIKWGSISVSREADVVGYECSLTIEPFIAPEEDYNNNSLAELIGDLVIPCQESLDLDNRPEVMIRPHSLFSGIFGRDFPIESVQLKTDRDMTVGGVKATARKGVVKNKGRFTSLNLKVYTTNKEVLLWQGETYTQNIEIK